MNNKMFKFVLLTGILLIVMYGIIKSQADSDKIMEETFKNDVKLKTRFDNLILTLLIMGVVFVVFSVTLLSPICNSSQNAYTDIKQPFMIMMAILAIVTVVISSMALHIAFKGDTKPVAIWLPLSLCIVASLGSLFSFLKPHGEKMYSEYKGDSPYEDEEHYDFSMEDDSIPDFEF